jgi:NhaA family Na+:H+ antiporter
MPKRQKKDPGKKGLNDQYADPEAGQDLTVLENQCPLPDEPIDKVLDPLKRFVQVESASGIVLLAATAAALLLANSPAADRFAALWETRAAVSIAGISFDMSLKHWINDGLMAVFFFVVGLEVKRELVLGELKDLRTAALPIAGALGGMLVPAGIYMLLVNQGPAADGWGIPMATDIAFVVGLLALFRDRIPDGLRVMLLSLAIADDIGAIVVIAAGYTQTIHTAALATAAGGLGLALILFRLGIRNTAVYALCMLLVWAALHESGIHATLAGVAFGLLVPTRSWVDEGRLGMVTRRTLSFLQGQGWSHCQDRYHALRQMERATRKSIAPQQRFENQLHPWTGFVIMPLFALANAGVAIRPEQFTDPVAVAVVCGLVLGKPLGIVTACWLAVKSGLARLPRGVTWGAMLGAGCLTGIGFTMSLFIAGLALQGQGLEAAKTGILLASLISAAFGTAGLIFFLPREQGRE